MFGESVKGSSYELDHGKEWLTDLSDVKIIKNDRKLTHWKMIENTLFENERLENA